MDVRIELPLGGDLLETLLTEDGGKGARDERNALLELRLLVGVRRLERAREVVEEGDYEVIDEEEAKTS